MGSTFKQCETHTREKFADTPKHLWVREFSFSKPDQAILSSITATAVIIITTVLSFSLRYETVLRFELFVENLYDSFTLLGREYFTFACFSIYILLFSSFEQILLFYDIINGLLSHGLTSAKCLFRFCLVVCVCVCVCVMPFILKQDRCEFRHGSTCIEDVCSQTSFTRSFSVVCVCALLFFFVIIIYFFFLHAFIVHLSSTL